MTTDDRLSRYLSQQAEGITLPPADATAVMRLGARRRTRRRAGFVGGLAVVGVLAATLAVRDPAADQQVDINYAVPNVAASTFDWSTVEPPEGEGLAQSNASAMLADGSVYALSTAPGPYREETFAEPPTLYRSADGTAWSAVEGPEDLSVTSLSASGDTLYALGTAPAGGSTRTLVLASSTDGAASWSSLRLSGELSELDARHPEALIFSAPQVAAADADHVVASVVVTADLDAVAYRPELREHQGGWAWTSDGLVVYEEPPDQCAPGVTEAGDRASEEEVVRAAAACEEAVAARGQDAMGNPPVIARYSFDELGVDPELRDHVPGRIYTYVSRDGAPFERVALPQDRGWISGLVWGGGSFHLVVGQAPADIDVEAPPSTTVLRSVDGETWDVAASLPGSPVGAGMLAERLAVATQDRDGATVVNVQQPSSTWSSFDPGTTVTLPDGASAWTWPVSFGPLGMAAVVQTSQGDDPGPSYVVHSADGSSFEVQRLDELLDADGRGGVAGVAVTADAISIRYVEATDDDPDTPPTQTVLVGTPTA